MVVPCKKRTVTVVIITWETMDNTFCCLFTCIITRYVHTYSRKSYWSKPLVINHYINFCWYNLKLNLFTTSSNSPWTRVHTHKTFLTWYGKEAAVFLQNNKSQKPFCFPKIEQFFMNESLFYNFEKYLKVGTCKDSRQFQISTKIIDSYINRKLVCAPLHKEICILEWKIFFVI